MLYQQGTQRIEVIVRKEDNGSSGVGETPTENIGGGEHSETRGGTWAKLTGSTSVARQHRVVKTNLTHFLAMTRQVGLLALNYWIGGQGMENGDQALQDRISRTAEIIEDTTGWASSVAMGALYGSWGGPIGTILGATMAGVSGAASLGVKYKSRERDYNFKVFKENNAIEYKKSRANINLVTGRLR